MPQTAVTQNIQARFAGRVSTTVPKTTRTGTAAVACAFGLLLLRSPTDAAGVVRPPANLSAIDADAIMTAASFLSSAAATVYDAADFDGAVGPADLRPCRRLQFVFDAHGDWNPTIGVLWGVREDGTVGSEEIRIATSATRQTQYSYRKVIKFEMPAQTGAGGTATLGYLANVSPVLIADVDAIDATVASAAAVQTLGEANFDGVLANTYFFPPRQITFICDASGDWDATNVLVEGEDLNGVQQNELIAIATSTTATTVKRYSKVTGITIPVQTGAGGTATIGVAADAGGWIQWGMLYNHDGVAEYSDTLEEAQIPVGWPATSNVPCLMQGEIDMTSELATIAGAQVFVRIVTGVGEVAGQVRMDDDAGDAVPVAGMFFAESRVAGPVTVRVGPAV